MKDKSVATAKRQTFLEAILIFEMKYVFWVQNQSNMFKRCDSSKATLGNMLNCRTGEMRFTSSARGSLYHVLQRATCCVWHAVWCDMLLVAWCFLPMSAVVGGFYVAATKREHKCPLPAPPTSSLRSFVNRCTIPAAAKMEEKFHDIFELLYIELL